MDVFAGRLNEALRANGMSQGELAKKINMTKYAVSSYCRGKTKPSFDVLFSICKVLNESADYLLGLTD